MPRKPKPKWDDPEESKRFIETARAIGSDETGEEFRKSLKKIHPSSVKRARPRGD
jgi:hypothetical protein